MDKITAKIIVELYFGKGWDNPKFTIDDIFDFFKKSEQSQVKSAIRDLKRNALIKQTQNYKNSVLVLLSEKGKLRALSLIFRGFEEKKEKWDGKWRFVSFDIPVYCTKGRKALVYRLKSGGFYELQRSLFLYPYDCEKEIKALAKLLKIEKYIIFGSLYSLDNQERLIHHFKLK